MRWWRIFFRLLKGGMLVLFGLVIWFWARSYWWHDGAHRLRVSPTEPWEWVERSALHSEWGWVLITISYEDEPWGGFAWISRRQINSRRLKPGSDVKCSRADSDSSFTGLNESGWGALRWHHGKRGPQNETNSG